MTATSLATPSPVERALVDADHRRRLVGLARLIVRSDEDAEDVVQAAMEKAYRHRKRFDSSRAVEPWLARIVCNEAISLARKERLRKWVTLRWDEPDRSESLPLSERLAVQEAVDRLNAKHRVVVALFYLWGYSIHSIASLLQIPQGTVASRLNHARDTLREALEEEHR
jgi:RNA polymerase sigma-70 factor (ECF subfamily)